MGDCGVTERILVAEPERDVAALLQSLLSGEGYLSEVLELSAVGQDDLTEGAVDLVIVDVYAVPGGVATAAETLAGLLGGREVPVLCMSTDALAPTAADSRLNVVGFIEMPFDADALLEKVRVALDEARARAAQSGGPALPEWKQG